MLVYDCIALLRIFHLALQFVLVEAASILIFFFPFIADARTKAGMDIDNVQKQLIISERFSLCPETFYFHVSNLSNLFCILHVQILPCFHVARWTDS